MKIIVQSIEKPSEQEIQGTLSDSNKNLIDIAFNLQNFYLANLGASEPKDIEVIISVFYNPNGEINWAFANDPGEEVKTIIRETLAKFNKG